MNYAGSSGGGGSGGGSTSGTPRNKDGYSRIGNTPNDTKATRPKLATVTPQVRLNIFFVQGSVVIAHLRA